MSITITMQVGAGVTSISRFMMKVVGMAMLLLLISCYAVSAASAGNGRRLLSGESSSFTMTMMHRDHLDSPLRDSAGNYSFTERLKGAVERSKQRSHTLRRNIAMLTSNGTDYHTRETQLLGVRSKVSSQQGEYIVQFQLGSPPQKFVAILDSGSDLNWVQCSTCTTRIPTPNPPFNPGKSTSFEKVACANTYCSALPLPRLSCSTNCRYQYGYGDGTCSIGDFSTETLTLATTRGGTAAIPNFAFGCGQQNSGDLAGSDGIVGIGQGPYSMTSQLGAIVGKRFAFCLVNMYEETTVTSPLVIGGDAFWPAGGSLWTPIVKNPRSPTYYYLQIQCIKVNGRCLTIPASTFAIDSLGRGGTIMDTGTTMTELLPAAFNVLVDFLKRTIIYPETSGDWYGFDVCWDTTGSDAPPVFPKVSFTFSWNDFNMPQDNVFMQVDYDVYCLGMTSGYGLSIIGNIQLQNFYVFVNRETNVIGWKPAQCDQMR